MFKQYIKRVKSSLLSTLLPLSFLYYKQRSKSFYYNTTVFCFHFVSLRQNNQPKELKKSATVITAIFYTYMIWRVVWHPDFSIFIYNLETIALFTLNSIYMLNVLVSWIKKFNSEVHILWSSKYNVLFQPDFDDISNQLNTDIYNANDSFSWRHI